MDLYKLKDKQVTPVDKSAFDLEKDIQVLVEANLSSLFNLQFVASEFVVDEFRIDTLAFDEENSAFVIIEYKKGSSYSVVDQGYSYLSKMLAKQADFVLEYQERTGKIIKRVDIDWSQSKVVFISPSFNAYQKNSVNFRDVPFELWEIRKYGNDLIGLEQHKSTSKESIEKFSATNTEISNVSSEIKVLDESYHTGKISAECSEMWNEIKDHFSELGDTSFSIKTQYISIKRDNVAICFVHFKKTNLIIDIRQGNVYPDGTTKSSGYFELDDPKHMAEKKEFTWSSGVKGNLYSINLKNKSDKDYVLFLLKQKYAAIEK